MNILENNSNISINIFLYILNMVLSETALKRVEAVKAKAAERRAQAQKAKKTELVSSEVNVRFIEIQHNRRFFIKRFYVYAESDLVNPKINTTTGWTGNFQEGDPNKQMQRVLNFDLGQEIIVGRIFLDLHRDHHNFPQGAVIILKDKNQVAIPTQYLQGQKVLPNANTADIRYNLTLKPVDYSSTTNKVNAERDKKLQEVEKMKEATKAKSEEMINQSKQRVEQMKKDAETKLNNSKYNSEQRAKENQRQNKCKATNQIYKIQLKTMQTYCANMGNTPESQDSRCINLRQQKQAECFGNTYDLKSKYSMLIYLINLVLCMVLILHWFICLQTKISE